ncbi:MAG TPA: hypothetical protein VHG51_08795 [Longimicrobiaceae bacterium]|nr:hypothetical protein [Longimicrobiaceae bacterium]
MRRDDVPTPPIADPGLRPAPSSTAPRSRGGRLVRLTTSCPRCGSRPALRVTEELLLGLEPPAAGDTRIGTYQCHRRGCGTIYDLYVGAHLLEAEGTR